MIMMAKRFADWLEKMSVAAFAVGLFQSHDAFVAYSAIALGIGAFSTSMALSWYLGRTK